MAATLEELAEAVREGEIGAEDDLVAALASPDVAPSVLLDLFADGHPGVRAAVARAAGRRTGPLADEVLGRAVADPQDAVRLAAGRALGERPAGAGEGLVTTLLRDPVPLVRIAALPAAAARPGCAGALVQVLHEDDDWNVRLAAAQVLAEADPATFLGPLATCLAEDEDRDVARAAARALERLLERTGPATPPVRLAAGLSEAATARAKAAGASRSKRLLAWLEALRRDDPERLRRFGRDLTEDAAEGALRRAHRVDAACDAVIAALTGERRRSVVLLGPPGSGKTAVVHEVVHRLRAHPAGPWRVLQVGSSDLLAGTVYLGEWQTKVRDLLEAISAPQRVVLYVPQLAELAHAGRSSRNDLNVATMLAPHVESGAIAILGESTPEAFRAGLGADPSLRRLFPSVELAEADATETRAVLRAVRDEEGLAATDAELDTLQELAGMYLPGTAQPGRAVGLLRRVVEARGGRGPLGQREVLLTLASSTGIPVDLLDDALPLDVARVRQHFEARVMGQPEAVSAVLDLVALVKAGLTDPQKPYGVLLFVGPTGVGKTELARALAELLFGDPARLLRFDMSEYAAPMAHERLTGRAGEPGTLTSAVREHPFSVVLLDEIEKAHLNVFDLLLQVFDAGRLTDGQGRTVDFRRTIVILTSNLGAAVPTEAAMGFGGGDAPPEAPDRDAILREVLRFFRPEFVNRLDQVVSFRPLALETAEQIARREVARVLERSGIARRRLSVDVDPSVFALLLRLGYSPAFGARPLKRTVERCVLLPVAHAIAHGGAPPGSILRLVARGERTAVEVVPAAEAEAERAPETEPSPTPAATRARRLAERAAALLARTQPLAARKSEVLAASGGAGFWKDRDAARRALDEVHRLEQVVEAAARVARRAEGLRESLATSGRRSAREARVEEGLAEVERELGHAETLVGRASARDLGDAYLRLTRVRAEGEDLDAVHRLAAMYEGFARRRGFEVETVDERTSTQPPEETVTLLVAGAGAHALLAGEEGLHQFTRKGSGRGRQAARAARAFVRVEVLAAPQDDAHALRGATRVASKPLRGAKGRRGAHPTSLLTLLHEPTMVAVTAACAGPKEAALTRLFPLLQAEVQRRASPPPGSAAVVRRYDLGASPRASDPRTGRGTGHLERVLRGEIDLLATRDAPAAPGP